MTKKRMRAPLETNARICPKAIPMIPQSENASAPEAHRGVDALFGAQVPERAKMRGIEKPGSVADDIAAIFRENARLRCENRLLAIENDRLKRAAGGDA